MAGELYMPGGVTLSRTTQKAPGVADAGLIPQPALTGGCELNRETYS
jgi:hypothetical protein